MWGLLGRNPLAYDLAPCLQVLRVKLLTADRQLSPPPNACFTIPSTLKSRGPVRIKDCLRHLRQSALHGWQTVDDVGVSCNVPIALAVVETPKRKPDFKQ